MKNGKMKLNKTKIIARVMLVVLLFAGTLNLAGCSISVKPSQVNKGQYYDKGLVYDSNVSLMIVSDTNAFFMDDVSFQVYIGLHKKSYSLIDWLTKDQNELLYKTNDISEIADFDKEKNFYYVLYATNYGDDIKNDMENLLNYAYILKEISFEESLKNGAYNFTKMPFTTDYHYNYSEKITIPKECIMSAIENEYHVMRIGIAYAEKIDDGEIKYGPYVPTDVIGVSIHCYLTEEGAVYVDLPQMK